MGERRQAQPMPPESSGPEEAPAEDRPRADQEARQSQGQSRSTALQIDTGKATAAQTRRRSQREPFSQLQALTDRQKERPERRSLGESIPPFPDSLLARIAADVGTAGIHRLSRSHDCGRANKNSPRPLQDLSAGLNLPYF